MKLSVLIGSRNRPKSLQRCVESVLAQRYNPFEIVILDDASDDPSAYAYLVNQIGDERVRLISSTQQLGVAGGRNYLFQQATGDVFFVIDDDVELLNVDTLEHLATIFSQDASIGIVACKIVDIHKNVCRKLLPFSQSTLRRFPSIEERAQMVSYFLGGAHGIRRLVIETCGGYQPNLIYGGEELDLSYRIIDHGWKIYYEPAITVHHYPESSVVSSHHSPSTELFHHIKNRIYLAYRYLPGRYITVHLLVWLIIYLGMAIRMRCPAAWLRGVIAGIKMTREVHRTPLSPHAVQYLRKHFGRLWY